MTLFQRHNNNERATKERNNSVVENFVYTNKCGKLTIIEVYSILPCTSLDHALWHHVFAIAKFDFPCAWWRYDDFWWLCYFGLSILFVYRHEAKQSKQWMKKDTTISSGISKYMKNVSLFVSMCLLYLCYFEININKVRLHSMEMRVAESAKCDGNLIQIFTIDSMQWGGIYKEKMIFSNEIYEEKESERESKRNATRNRYDIAYNAIRWLQIFH